MSSIKGNNNDVISYSTTTPNVLTAKYIATMITIIPKPLRESSKIKLFKEYDGFNFTFENTNPTGIIDVDGNITRPTVDTNVEFILKIQNTKDTNDVATRKFIIPIDKTYIAPTTTLEEIANAKESYMRSKYGIFVHYVPNLTKNTSGQVVSDIDVLVDGLDVNQFANDVSGMGFEYVIFTVMHANQLLLYPSEVSKRWRDDRRKTLGIKTYSYRDLISDLSDVLKEKNIDLILYTHPCDGLDFSIEDQSLTGWLDNSNYYDTWNTFQNELYDELCKRYANKTSGLWFDGKYQNWSENNAPLIQQERFRKTLEAYNPCISLTANVSKDRNFDLFPEWTSADYRCWEVGKATDTVLGFASVNPSVSNTNSLTWPATKHQVALVAGSGWWATNKSATAPYSARNLYYYTVAQASISKSGGLAISAGCFPGTAEENSSGNIWETGFYNEMFSLKNLIDPVSESIKNTLPSKAFITNDHEWIDQKQWGVSTESPDGKYVYLHIVKPPVGNTLNIGKTQDESILSTKGLILKSNQQVDIVKLSSGYNITLPEDASWDTLDTVIKVERLEII